MTWNMVNTAHQVSLEQQTLFIACFLFVTLFQFDKLVLHFCRICVFLLLQESGWGVGDCLLKQKASLSKACIDFIDLQSICKDDIEKNCNGKEYTGDLLVCLTEWTKPDSLSAACTDKLPKKEAKEERKLSAAEKMKADRRRKARKEAAKRVKKEL